MILIKAQLQVLILASPHRSALLIFVISNQPLHQEQ
jgi:hypothetical protein